jgi:GTP-binding protein HflX
VGLGQEAHVEELRELCRTAGVRVMGVVEQRRPEADAKTLVGRGKLEELLIRAMQLDANVLIFDPDLTPGQAHAIADFTDLRVIDRTMLILDIFAQRAKSRDGKLQVELAQLRYRLPRLHEKNTMMSRLTGGIGGRGPGETKLEENRRRARERINRLEKEIEHYGRQRQGRRAQRGARGLPIVAIVGYTNAGKSTLLNTLTHSEVLAEDRLFATLDPTTRRLRFPREREIIIADTVGFIRDLPPDLAQAFRATLEELDEADLLLHIVDAADSDREAHIDAVERILGDLGLAETPRLMVMNKIDRLSPDEQAHLREGAEPAGQRPIFAISARERDTTKPLLDAIEQLLWREGRLVRTPRFDDPVGSSA